MKIERRSFLKLASLAAGGVLLHDLPSWAQVSVPPRYSSLGQSFIGEALPQSQSPAAGRALRVTILGAGLAGLSAGWELQRRGHEVVILEAQLHPGGRVHTIREGLSDDMYAEAGAGRIPNTHTVTLEWVKYFNLQLEPFWPTDGADVALLKGKRVKMPVGKPVDMSQLPLDLTPEERRIGLANFDEHYYGPTMRKIGGGIRLDWPPEIERLADISMADYLRQQGASEDAINYMLLGFQDDAALDFMRDSYSHHTESLAKIKGGNDQLPRAFAAKLSSQVRYGCAVQQIDHSKEKVSITYEQSGLQDKLESDAVICAIPFGVLRHIAVTPEWSPAKRHAIDTLSYGPVVRTTYQVNRRYWQDEGCNGFGSSDKNFEVWHPTYGKPGSRGLLQAYVYEKYAHALDQMSVRECTEQMIADMDAVHPGLRPHLETVIVKSWVNDPWQRGAYTNYYAGEQKLYPDVCRREGQVWFAGEHASPWPGWMQGAIASGMKAAKEINAESQGGMKVGPG